MRGTVFALGVALLGAGCAGAKGTEPTGTRSEHRESASEACSWKLVRSETFVQRVPVDEANWVRDPQGDASPWNVDDLDDDGKFYQVMGGADFARHLASFDVLRKRVSFGQDGWLTVEVAARDANKDGVPEAPPRVRNVRLSTGPALRIEEPSHDGGIILRSTRPLPARYRIETTLRTLDFGGQRHGNWDYDGKNNGYATEGCKTNFPWKRQVDFSGPSSPCNPNFNDVRTANGYYFLAIVDYPNPAPHNNVFIHTHRKVGMDGYNVRDAEEGADYAVCNPTTRQTYNYAAASTGNGINAIFFAGERYQNPFIGYNAFDMPTACGTFDQTSPPRHSIVSAAELRPELMPNEDYTFAIERSATGYVMEMSGRFLHTAHTKLRYERPFVSSDGKAAVWHYNNTAEEYDGRFDTPLTFGDSKGDPAHQYVHEHMWPRGSAYPDYFLLGDPHLNYYEGSATVTGIQLYVPADESR